MAVISARAEAIDRALDSRPQDRSRKFSPNSESGHAVARMDSR